MDCVRKYQNQLLEQIKTLCREMPISEPTNQAYLAIPRHRFVQRYREWGTKEWHVVNMENLAQHLATLYADCPLILFGNDDQNVLSTISQPSLVLRMLDLLELKEGDKVLELGAGSGWSAALMGRIVGQKGHVVSLEIIPELAQNAAENIASLGIANVQILTRRRSKRMQRFGSIRPRSLYRRKPSICHPASFAGPIRDGIDERLIVISMCASRDCQRLAMGFRPERR